MRRLTMAWALLAGLWAGVTAAWAEDLAVIFANEFYNNHPRVQNTRAITDLSRDFRDAGFSVRRFSNTRSDFSDQTGLDLWRRMRQADRVVFVFSGHMVHSFGQNWLLHTDAGAPNALTLWRAGLPLRPFLAIAASKQGDAVVAIAEDPRDLQLGDGLLRGYKPRGIGQGVTVLVGNQGQIGSFISGELLRPSQSLHDAVKAAPSGFQAFGYLPRSQSFLPLAAPGLGGLNEQAAWQWAEQVNTLAAYEDYLAQFPNGLFAAEAQRRVNDLRLTPQDRARLAEEALNLTRDQRRAIQRNLTLLGFNTFGIDGILGNRSRNAVAKWQRSIGVLPTGFLNANQISRIEVAAAARAAELRQQAEARRREEERRDRQYWQQTGASGTEAGLRSYLQRHPDGLYSEQARQQLGAIEREKRRLARAAEREAWDRAVIEGTLQSYQGYLNDYPNGRFAEEARARIQSLSQPETPPAVVLAAKQEEQRLNLSGITRSLIEGQLRKLNFDPGQVDGRFTDKTRRALRRFQRANNMAVTGYVTREVIVRLLASAIDN